MHVPFLSLLLLSTALLQFAEVVVTEKQKGKYQLFRGFRKRIRPALGRRRKVHESEERAISTAFLHGLVDLKGTTTTTTCPPPTDTSPTSPTSPATTGPTTITSSSPPPLTAPATIATSTSPLSTSRAFNIDEKVDDKKHIRKSAEEEDEDDFIPYTIKNKAHFAALGKMQSSQGQRGRNKLVKRERRGFLSKR